MNSNLTSKINLINCKIDNIEVKIDNIDKDIIKINEKIDLLIEIINKDVKENCQKMSSHIDFIQKVYENVKAPMNYICSKFNNLMLLDNN